MKIVCKDNFDSETVSDMLVASDLNEYFGKLILEFLLDKHTSDYGPDYYQLVPDDYELYTYEP